MEKDTFWTRPIPESILNLFRPLWKHHKRKPRSEKGIRRLLIVMAAVSVVLILLINGLSNPADYLVDIPSFSLGDMMAAYPEYAGYYFIGLLAVTAAMTGVVNWILGSEEEISSFSINGILLWLVGVAVGLLADAVTRECLLEAWIIPVFEHRNDSYEAAWAFVYMLIATMTAWYFVMDDFMGNALSITLAPYVMYALDWVIPETGIFSNTIVIYLALTFALKVLLNFLGKHGVDQVFADFFRKYLYTPKYLLHTYLYIFLFPLLPFILIWKLLRRKKRSTQTAGKG